MDRVNGALAELEDQDEPEITTTPSVAAGSAPAPVAEEATQPTYTAPAPGLTPAFATAGASHGSAPAEPARSIWDWPGPQREPRRSSGASASSGGGAPAGGSSSGSSSGGSEEAAASEPRTSGRGGALPSLPRTPPATSAPRTEPARDHDATMILSPPPAPTPAPASTPAPTPAKASGRSGKAAAPAPASAPAPTPAAAAPPAASSPAPAAPSVPSRPTVRVGGGVPAPAPPPAAAPPAPVAAVPAPTPAAPPLAAPALPAPEVAPSAAGRPPRRAHSDSVGAAFDQAMEPGPDGGPSHGVSTSADLAEVRRVFNEVAAIHVSQVRDVMLELRYGEAQPSWIESTQPALRSLRTMAAQMELTDLCAALDGFCVAVDAATGGRARIDEAGKAELLRRYELLIELIPQAFELDAERDRREPIIVESLLYQIEGVERRTIEKLFAVGLHRLDALMRATSDEISVVAGLRPEIADAIVEQFQSYRTAATSALSAPDPMAERRQLGDLLIMLSVANDEYTHASTRWSDDAKARKAEARKQREQVFQRIKVALARLGEREQLARLEKMPFHERIATLDRYLSAAIPARAQPGKP